MTKEKAIMVNYAIPVEFIPDESDGADLYFAGGWSVYNWNHQYDLGNAVFVYHHIRKYRKGKLGNFQKYKNIAKALSMSVRTIKRHLEAGYLERRKNHAGRMAWFLTDQWADADDAKKLFFLDSELKVPMSPKKRNVLAAVNGKLMYHRKYRKEFKGTGFVVMKSNELPCSADRLRSVLAGMTPFIAYIQVKYGRENYWIIQRRFYRETVFRSINSREIIEAVESKGVTILDDEYVTINGIQLEAGTWIRLREPMEPNFVDDDTLRNALPTRCDDQDDRRGDQDSRREVQDTRPSVQKDNGSIDHKSLPGNGLCVNEPSRNQSHNHPFKQEINQSENHKTFASSLCLSDIDEDINFSEDKIGSVDSFRSLARIFDQLDLDAYRCERVVKAIYRTGTTCQEIIRRAIAIKVDPNLSRMFSSNPALIGQGTEQLASLASSAETVRSILNDFEKRYGNATAIEAILHAELCREKIEQFIGKQNIIQDLSRLKTCNYRVMCDRLNTFLFEESPTRHKLMAHALEEEPMKAISSEFLALYVELFPPSDSDQHY